MKNSLLIIGLSVMVILSACQKEASVTSATPDSTSKWVGTYNVANPTGNSGPTQVQITSAGNNTIKVIIRIEQFSYIYTASTLQGVTINGNTATINETQNIIEATDLGPYAFTGTLQLNGNTLALSANAVSVRNPVNVEYSPMNFAFSGNKVQ